MQDSSSWKHLHSQNMTGVSCVISQSFIPNKLNFKVYVVFYIIRCNAVYSEMQYSKPQTMVC